LFTSALLFPLLPFSPADYLPGLLIYIVVVSFIFGLFANALGEPIRRLNSFEADSERVPDVNWWLADSITVFQKVINKQAFDKTQIPMSREISHVDEALVDSAVEHLRDDLEIPASEQTAPKNYQRHETVAFYQYALNQVWAASNSPAKIHHSIRMFARSLVAASLFALVLTGGIVGLQFVQPSIYTPVYVDYFPSQFPPHRTMAGFYGVMLFILIMTAVYVHKRYTYYLCIYMLSEFVHQHQ
jgi:hypothetical protein